MVGDDSELRCTSFPVGQICSFVAETSRATADEVCNDTGYRMAQFVLLHGPEEIMLKLNIDNIGDLAIVECEGRIVSEAAFKLRDAVTSQCQASTVVVELSEVQTLEGGGLGMLIFLQRWARDHGIRFKLFNPSAAVRKQLKMVGALAEFEIPTLDEMMALLGQADIQYAMTA
jgi:anti-anti-sigma factor